jgi:predicted O-linked N-acetylglucosamine transferase (SPINDLY family)
VPVIQPSAQAIVATRQGFARRLDALRRAGVRLTDPLREVGSTNFNLAYHGLDDRELQVMAAEFYTAACPSLSWVAPHCAPGAPARQGPPRIGFVSRFFREHSIGRLMLNLIEHLAARGLEVFVFGFPQAPDPVWTEIGRTARLAATLPLDLAAARRVIAEHRLDLLFYPDVGMEPMTYFLAFARLAPVQCVTWGHPVTTGIPTLDYFLSCDAAEPPDAEAHYSERLVRLNGLPMSYRRPSAPSPLKPRAAYGLEDGRPLYFCAQSLFKLHPDFDPMLAGILRADPTGRLLLLHGTDPHLAELLLARWRQTMGDVLDRILVLPRQSHADYMNLLAIADVSLDSWPFSGGNTSYQALAVGTPVVTLPGAYLRGRLTLAIYRRMGMAELVAADAEDYVRIAVRLGTDPAWRAALRAEIAARSERIFDDPAFLEDAERFLLEVLGTATAPG